jgi:UDP-N-acetylmuramoylalanine--D-glutamate ligase
MELAGARVTVMGLGRFGGGVGVTRWLAAQGADVLVTDLDPAEKLAEPLAAISSLVDSGTVRLRLGEHNASDFTGCDLVVANPAVPRPWENRFLRAAEAARVPVTTEITLLLSRLPEAMRERAVGVTGSVGKSTTTAMVHAGLSAAAGEGERVLLGGNIGGSLLGGLGRIDDRAWLVLELSSAMLYWVERVFADRPTTSTGTGTSPTTPSPSSACWCTSGPATRRCSAGACGTGARSRRRTRSAPIRPPSPPR